MRARPRAVRTVGAASAVALVAGLVAGAGAVTATAHASPPDLQGGTPVSRAEPGDPVLTRLGDLVSSSEASDPVGFVEVGSRTFFTAETPALGRELWSTTGAGATVAADIAPGSESARIGERFVRGTTMYFAAGPDFDIELWRTSGDTVVRAADINPGPAASSSPQHFTTLGDDLYFVASGTAGRRIYRIDVNGATSLVGGPSFASDLAGLEEGLVLRDRDDLWFSDGTDAGTALVREFEDSTGDFYVLDGVGYFTADDDGNGFDLWRTDGTIGGTVKVRDYDIGTAASAPRFVGDDGGFAYFVADDGTTGRDLWRTNGSGVTKVEVVSGVGAPGRIGDFVRLGDQVAFAASSEATGVELHKLDGSGLPVMVQDTNPGSGNGLQGDPVLAGDRVYFAGSDGARVGLYSSTNLMATGTSLVKEMFNSVAFGPSALTQAGGGAAARGTSLIFRGFDDEQGAEPWISDGSASGTRLLADLNTQGQPSFPRAWTTYGDRVAFMAVGDGVGNEIHVTDGTVAGTRLLADLAPGRGGTVTNATPMVATGNRLYAASTQGLVVSDGTPATTRIIEGERPNAEAVIFDGQVYYVTGFSSRSEALYTSDGTSGGTRQVMDFDASGDDDVRGLNVLGDGLLFSAGQAGESEGLWRLGRSGGPVLLKEIDGKQFLHDGTPFAVETAAVVGDTLYFSVADPDSPTGDLELWKSDGTTAGTVLVKVLSGAGSSGRGFGLFTAWGDRLVFTADVGGDGSQIWASDGTGAGTVAVSAVEDAEIEDLVVLGDEIIFVADEGLGRELYATAGVAAETRLIKDINPGGSALPNHNFGFSQGPHLLAAYDGGVYFAADDGSRGRELWRTDGTTAGTNLFAELQPGALGGDPAELTALESGVYFRANDGTGDEPWRLALPEPPEPPEPPVVPDTTAPALKLAAKKKQKQGKKVVVKVKVTADEAARVSVAGKVTAGKKKYPLKATSTSLAADASTTLRLVAKNKRTAKKITKALKKWRKAPKRAKKKLAVKATLTGSAVDAAGNRGRATRTTTLT